MADPNPLDGAPVDHDLDRAFRLPSYIREDQELVELYNTLVHRLRREASGLPMNTLQMILIERQASFYVQIKYKEDHQNFSPNQQKEFNVYWLDLTKEFNRLLSQSEDKIREALLGEIAAMTQDVAAGIEDDAIRRKVRLALSEGFANIGL